MKINVPNEYGEKEESRLYNYLCFAITITQGKYENKTYQKFSHTAFTTLFCLVSEIWVMNINVVVN